MHNYLLIFLGSGLGGILRYFLSTRVYMFLGKEFPYGTLFVNVSGSLVMGFLYILITDRFEDFAPELRSLFLIGFLGGYTTFSSFSIETMQLIENGQWMGAGMNIIFSIILCITAAWIGIIGARIL